MKFNKTIIFCQAPADVPFVLDLYEKNKSQHAIYIYVINVEGLYTFLASLDLNIEKLVFIPYHLKNLKRVDKLFKERGRIKHLWKNEFNQLENGKLYFFSRFEDWLTGSFIQRFAKKKNMKIWYVDHYDDSALLYAKNSKFHLRRFLYQIILKYLTRVNFKTQIVEKLPEFPICKYSIEKKKPRLNLNVFDKYSYLIDSLNLVKPKVFFLVSPCEELIFNCLSYDQNLLEIIKTFKDIGFQIIIKGHPRIGIPNSIKGLVDIEVPCYVPGEFINSNQFDLCLGIDSKSICHFVNNTQLPTYSLMKLFQASNNGLHNIGVDYLLQQTDNKIQFCKSRDELESIAKEIKIKSDER